MLALNLFNGTPKFITCTMFLMFTDELSLGFETIYSSLTGLWYGQEKSSYPLLLILLQFFTINFCSRHFLESDFPTVEWVHLNRVAVPGGSDSASHPLPQPHTPSLDSLSSAITLKDYVHVVHPTRTCSKHWCPPL
jgi:hypothetical protein